MDRVHARWLVAAAVVSSVAGLVMCPAGTLVLAAILFLLNLDMTPRALDCRLRINVICTVLLALGLMATLEAATVWWAVLACPPLVWLLGSPRADDISRHDRARPERPWEKRRRRRGRGRSTVVVVSATPPRAIQQQPVWDLHESRSSGDRTMWR